jgi:hypothetical protein
MSTEVVANYSNDYVAIDTYLRSYDSIKETTIRTGEPFEGYTLFSPLSSTKTFLINNDGEIVHEWKSDSFLGHGVYLLENGNLIRSCLPRPNPRFISGGVGGRVEMFDWNGTLVWEFEYSTDKYCLHHDIEVLPNGNILMIAWEYKSYSEAVAAGRKPGKLQAGELWPDFIIEVKPTGSSGGDIVWEWHVWDHLIQDNDPSKDNFGVVADHPELIDINYGNPLPDWLHTNSIDYNEEFDQIILSVRGFSEIWIIDHSTTTEEAAGHTGGRSGKGGDLLYRWGNPRTYRAGYAQDQKFFAQHDAQWIESGCPGEGNILVFNNGAGRPGRKYSSVDELVPPVDSNGNYYLEPGDAYGPKDVIWSYTAENPPDFYSGHISGAQRMPNGNTIICEGAKGRFFEVTLDMEIVWEYLNKIPNLINNDVFTIRRYAPDYPGLAGLFSPPDKPNIPSGPTSGKAGVEYTYSSYTSDPDDHEIFYLFDWGDGTDSGWLGPYPSGEEVNASHAWDKKGNYEIRVKAKDILGAESEWSDPLSISISRNKANSLLSQQLKEILLHFFSGSDQLFLFLRDEREDATQYVSKWIIH